MRCTKTFHNAFIGNLVRKIDFSKIKSTLLYKIIFHNRMILYNDYDRKVIFRKISIESIVKLALTSIPRNLLTIMLGRLPRVCASYLAARETRVASRYHRLTGPYSIATL